MLHLNIEKTLASFTLKLNHTMDCEGVTAILGVSGSGKSTLINLINGLVKPDFGVIKLDNQTLVDTDNHRFICAQNRRIGTIFQDPLLFPHYTVLKNLQYGLHQEMASRFAQIVDVLNIRSLLKRYPATLSGGEKQRVAIGRALLTHPKLLLMDEPFSALDMPRKKELIHYITHLVDEIKIPIIYVTHNLFEVKNFARNVAIIEQGKLYDYGDTQTILRSEYLMNWL